MIEHLGWMWEAVSGDLKWPLLFIGVLVWVALVFDRKETSGD